MYGTLSWPRVRLLTHSTRTLVTHRYCAQSISRQAATPPSALAPLHPSPSLSLSLTHPSLSPSTTHSLPRPSPPRFLCIFFWRPILKGEGLDIVSEGPPLGRGPQSVSRKAICRLHPGGWAATNFFLIQTNLPLSQTFTLLNPPLSPTACSEFKYRFQ